MSPSQPVPGSTVVLSTISTLTERIVFIKRSASSRFMPGAYVFPGGKMDEDDLNQARELLSSPNCPSFFNPFHGIRNDQALAFYLCGIRETAEETGVLLVTKADGKTLLSLQEWERIAPSVLAYDSFWMGLREHNLNPHLEFLVPISRWITPVIEPRRFDAVFFVATIPNGQSHEPSTNFSASSEVSDLQVLAPADAIAMHHQGTILLPPPTLATLESAIAAGGIGALKNKAFESKELLPYCPHAVFNDAGQLLLTLPGHPDFVGPNAHPLPGRTVFSQVEGMRFR